MAQSLTAGRWHVNGPSTQRTASWTSVDILTTDCMVNHMLIHDKSLLIDRHPVTDRSACTPTQCTATLSIECPTLQADGR